MSGDQPDTGAAPSACTTCGACCHSYRVEFSIYELDSLGGGVPEALTEVVDGATCRMRGTGAVPIRCVALEGELGVRAICRIYPQRPRPCAELPEGSYGCNKARTRHGLPPLGEWLGE